MFLEHTWHIHLSSLEAVNGRTYFRRSISLKRLEMFSLTNRTRLVAGYTVLLQMETPGGGVPPIFLLSQISSRPRIPFIKNSEHFVFSITSAVVTSAQVISSINIFSNSYGIAFFALQVAPSTEPYQSGDSSSSPIHRSRQAPYRCYCLAK
jgi:hypothetical protein